MTRGAACRLSRDIRCGSWRAWLSRSHPPHPLWAGGFEKSHATDTEGYFIIERNQGRATLSLGFFLSVFPSAWGYRAVNTGCDAPS